MTDEKQIAQEIANLKNYWQSDDISEKYYNTVNASRYFVEVELPLYRKYLTKEDSVIDMGAGTGILSLALADYVKTVVSCDVSREMLNQIEKHKKENITIFQADIVSYDFSSMEKFDAVVSRWFIPHFKKWRDLLKKMKTLCKKDGFIIFDILSAEHTMFSKMDISKVNLLLGYQEYMANVSLSEMKDFCAENNLELVEIIPYHFLEQSTFALNALTVEEFMIFRSLIRKLSQDKKYVKIIRQIEEQVISKLPQPLCYNSLVILKNED